MWAWVNQIPRIVSSLAAIAARGEAAVRDYAAKLDAWQDEIIVTGARNPEDSPVVAAARRRLSRTPGAVAVVHTAAEGMPGVGIAVAPVPLARPDHHGADRAEP